jgi:hypothetical protein
MSSIAPDIERRLTDRLNQIRRDLATCSADKWRERCNLEALAAHTQAEIGRLHNPPAPILADPRDAWPEEV